MMLLFRQSRSLTAVSPAHRPAPRRRAGFSLVEVTLAMGIVTFSMVAVVGVIPVAMSTGRQSFNQNRAAAVAQTVYAGIRSQPFSKVGYLDAHFGSDGYTAATSSSAAQLDLNKLTPSSPVTFYATFIDGASDAAVQTDTFGTQRRLCLTATVPAGTTSPGYKVVLRANNHPDGMMVDPATSAGAIAQASQVELVITPNNAATDSYRFTSIIANHEH